VTLRFSPDVAAADWIVRSPTPWEQLVTFGPAGHPAYARLRYVPDPVAPGQDEADVELPPDHPSDLARVRRALHLLAGHTATPDDCWFLLWEGYSDMELPAAVRRGPLVELPHRTCALVRGAVADIDGWAADLGLTGTCPPAMAWPADRSWCLASDVDPHWAGIGASAAAVDALLAEPGLDVVRARPAQEQPTCG
jgi:hypothetical protein